MRIFSDVKVICGLGFRNGTIPVCVYLNTLHTLFVGRICDNLGSSCALCEKSMKICSGFFFCILIPKIAGTTTLLQRFHPKNYKFKMATENPVNFHNSASNCLITLILVSKSMFWGLRNPLEHTKIKYVVIQVRKFHLFIKLG